MGNLEQRITEWRQALAVAGCGPNVLDELESHLREDVHRLVLAGEPEERALETALTRLGSPAAVAAEFAKVAPLAPWLPIRVAYGLVILLAVGACVLAVLFEGNTVERPASPLLRVHVSAITLGYGMTFLAGALAACYVLDRSLRGLTAGQSRSLTIATLRLSGAAAVLTALGILLGAVWAKEHLGRYWDWDMREVGGVLVLIWTMTVALLAWRRPVAVRSLMMLTLVGNLLVAGAWFGPYYLTRELQGFGQSATLSLLIFAGLQVVLFTVGLAPPGILKRQRA